MYGVITNYFLNLFRKVIGKQITPLRFLEILNYNVPYITKKLDPVLKMNLHHLDKLYVNNSATIAICNYSTDAVMIWQLSAIN